MKNYFKWMFIFLVQFAYMFLIILLVSLFVYGRSLSVSVVLQRTIPFWIAISLTNLSMRMIIGRIGPEKG